MRNEILKLLETDSRLTVKDIAAMIGADEKMQLDCRNKQSNDHGKYQYAADDCCDSLCLLFVTEIK